MTEPRPFLAAALLAPARSARPLIVAFAATLALVAACGVRTDPRPPEDTAARPPDGFRVKAVESGIELRWERVTRAMDGERLYDLAAFHVERRSDDGRFETIAKIPVTDTDRLRTQKVFRYVDAAPPAGTLEYRVRAVTEDGEHGMASEVLGVTTPAPSNEAAPGAEPQRSAPPAPSK